MLLQANKPVVNVMQIARLQFLASPGLPFVDSLETLIFVLVQSLLHEHVTTK